jgi:peroxiredoxin
VVGLSTDDAATNQMFAKKLGLGFQVLGAPDEKVFEQLGLWMPAMGHPLPGVAFIDPCGGKDRVLRGRRPGRDQTDLIVRTLKKMSADATRCRTRT